MQRLRKPRLPKPPSLLKRNPRPRKLLLPRLPKLPRHLALPRRPQKPRQHLLLRLPRQPTLKLTRHHRQRVSNTSVFITLPSSDLIIVGRDNFITDFLLFVSLQSLTASKAKSGSKGGKAGSMPHAVIKSSSP